MEMRPYVIRPVRREGAQSAGPGQPPPSLAPGSSAALDFTPLLEYERRFIVEAYWLGGRWRLVLWTTSTYPQALLKNTPANIFRTRWEECAEKYEEAKRSGKLYMPDCLREDDPLPDFIEDPFGHDREELPRLGTHCYALLVVERVPPLLYTLLSLTPERPMGFQFAVLRKKAPSTVFEERDLRKLGLRPPRRSGGQGAVPPRYEDAYHWVIRVCGEAEDVERRVAKAFPGMTSLGIGARVAEAFRARELVETKHPYRLQEIREHFVVYAYSRLPLDFGFRPELPDPDSIVYVPVEFWRALFLELPEIVFHRSLAPRLREARSSARAVDAG